MAEDNWRSALPPEYQNSDQLSRFKDLGGLVKSYLDQERFISTTGRVPKEDSKPEEWDKYYDHWGRPKDPKEYKVPDLPKEYALDDNFKSDMLKFAHELGLNQKQFNHMISWGLKQSQGIFEQQQIARQQEVEALKSKWGFRFDSKSERAKRTIAQLVGFKSDDPFVQWLQSTGNDTNPVVLEFFDRVAEEMGEDSFVDEQTKQEASDKEEARKKINEIRADQKHPYWNENDPRHKDAVAEMARYHEIVFAEG